MVSLKQRMVFCDEIHFRAVCGVGILSTMDLWFEPYLFSVLLL